MAPLRLSDVLHLLVKVAEDNWESGKSSLLGMPVLRMIRDHRTIRLHMPRRTGKTTALAHILEPGDVVVADLPTLNAIAADGVTKISLTALRRGEITSDFVRRVWVHTVEPITADDFDTLIGVYTPVRDHCPLFIFLEA